MKRLIPEHESLLEIGIVAVVGFMLTLALLLVTGWLVGSIQRSRRKSERAPKVGGVAHERHQQTGAAAAR